MGNLDTFSVIFQKGDFCDFPFVFPLKKWSALESKNVLMNFPFFLEKNAVDTGSKNICDRVVSLAKVPLNIVVHSIRIISHLLMSSDPVSQPSDHRFVV